MGFELDPSYKDVPTRIADFKAKHPEGSLQPADKANPYRIETIGSQVFVVFTAAAYRSPDDPTPGIGTAWEPFPGKTPYTRDSELQNAETSAWGRAIVAALASESKAIASAEEVRNRQADTARQDPPEIARLKELNRLLTPDQKAAYKDWRKSQDIPDENRSPEQIEDCISFLEALTKGAAA